MNRIPAIDTLRVFSILAVLTLHSRSFRMPGDLTQWESTAEIITDHACRFAVPFFFFASGFLFERGHRGGTRLDRTMPQLKRLLWLYLGWSVALQVWETTEIWLRSSLEAGHGVAIPWPDPATLPVKLIYGVRMHLWFLPALMQCLLLHALLGPDRRAGLIAVGLELFGLAGGAYMPVTGFDLGVWCRNTVFFGYLFVWAGAHSARLPQPPRLATAVAMITLGAVLHAVEMIYLHEFRGVSWINERVNFLAGTALTGIGVGLLALARPAWSLGSNTWLPTCGAFTLGVYLLHLDVMRDLAELIPVRGYLGQLLLVAITYLVSFAIARILACGKFTRKWVS